MTLSDDKGCVKSCEFVSIPQHLTRRVEQEQPCVTHQGEDTTDALLLYLDAAARALLMDPIEAAAQLADIQVKLFYCQAITKAATRSIPSSSHFTSLSEYPRRTLIPLRPVR